MSTASAGEVPGLIGRLLWEGTKLGPIVQLRMFMAAAPWLLSGISKAGAQSTIVAVDADREASTAAIAFTLAKLGFPGLVAAMSHEVVQADRPDAVVKISLEGMSAGYITELTAVTTELAQQGNYEDAKRIAQAMSEHGHNELLKLLTTEGPLKEVTEPIKDAVNWLTGKDPQAEASKKQAEGDTNNFKSAYPPTEEDHDDSKDQHKGGEAAEDEEPTRASIS